MHFYDAKVADVVRCTQRDEMLVQSLQEDIFSILKTLGAQNYSYMRKIVPLITNVWYYWLTSLDNLQTLGEEYTGTLRLTNNGKIPSKLLQILWLAIYIGGEAMYDRLLSHMKHKIHTSSIMDIAKNELLKFVNFMIENKLLFLRLHHSLFYINGLYYNYANRITGIKYVLLRQWLQDNSTTQSFNVLGKVSLAYLIFTILQRATSLSRNQLDTASGPQELVPSLTKVCSLCAENRKNSCATLCGHLFCWECIFDSLKYQQNCPICREVVHPSRIIFLQNYS